MSSRRVSYFYDADVGSYTYGLGHPMKPHRIRMAHELISAYNLLSHPHLTILRPPRATAEAMTAFHTDEYIHFLSRVTPETVEDLTFRGTQFLVGDDNPAFEGVWEFCTISAGGSLAAASRINTGHSDITINWAGGLHHAKKREASGFCYINDIVLAILDLLRVFPRVLYVDIDCHHGDGVEEAFYTTDRVLTCSFHKYGEYFPGTGTQEDRGRGRGRGYALNVPLKDGMSDSTFKSVFDPVMDRIISVFRPSAIILQCGADSLSGDKLGCFNLTMQGHAHCTSFLRAYNIPLILLGGGGYTVKNVARAWCYETGCALGVQDSLVDPNNEMPWNEYFEWFGPRYRLEVVKNNMEDVNLRIADPSDSDLPDSVPLPRTFNRSWKQTEIDRVRERALQQIKELEGRIGAPSVQMQDVPRESVGEHVGFKPQDEDDVYLGEKDELDERLAQHSRFVYNLQGPPIHLQTSSRQHIDSSSSSESDDDEQELDDDRPSHRERDDEFNDGGWDSDNSQASHLSMSRRSTRSQTRQLTNGRGGPHPRALRNGETSKTASSQRKRMSIITNTVFDIDAINEGLNGIGLCSGDVDAPPITVGSKQGKAGRRRFFFDTSADLGSGSMGLGGLTPRAIPLPVTSIPGTPVTREGTEDLMDLDPDIDLEEPGEDENDPMALDDSKTGSRVGTPRAN